MARRYSLVPAAVVCLLLTSLRPTTADAQVFLTSWGSAGSGDGHFQGGPSGVAVGGSGDIYVVDGSRVQVFTSGGTFLSMWSAFGPNIAVDANDNVFVGEQGVQANNFVSRIHKFSSTGTLLTEWIVTASANLAVDGSGNVYVPSQNNRLVVYNNSGVYLREWPTPSQGPVLPTGLDGLAVDAAGNVYVADRSNDRILKFANDGTLLTQWGATGIGNGQFSWPVRVAIGPQGYVHVVDYFNARVQVFTSDGAFVSQWGSYGSATSQFDAPIGIAVDSHGDIYVADTNNYRIQKFGFAPTPVHGVTWGALKSRYRRERGAVQPAQGK